MTATNLDATFDRITDNIEDMKGHVERLHQLVSTLIPTNPKPKVQTPCGESFPKEVAAQTCEGLSHRGKDEHTHERQGKIANFYTLVHVNDEHVTNKPLSVSSSLPTYEYIDSLPLVDDVHVMRVDTLVDRIDDRIDSSSKIDLCPPSVEAIVLNESTSLCENCVDQLVCKTCPPLENMCDVINESQVSEEFEDVGQGQRSEPVSLCCCKDSNVCLAHRVNHVLDISLKNDFAFTPLHDTLPVLDKYGDLNCDPFDVNGGLCLLEDRRANVSLSLWGVAHIRASMFDTLVFKLCEPQLEDVKLYSCLWKGPRMLKTSCHLHGVGQVEVSCGTLGSVFHIIFRGKPSSWANYLPWIGLLHGSFPILPVGMTPLMEYLPSVSGWKERGPTSLQCPFLSLCVPTCEYILDENCVFGAFLHYLYAYDDIHDVIGYTSYKRPEEGCDASIIRADSLKRAEMAADLLQMKWSTNLTPKRYNKDYGIPVSAQDMSKGAEKEDLQINDKKGDMSSLAYGNMLENLDFREPAREKDDGSHPSFQTREKSVKKIGKHMLFSASENAASVSIVQDVEDYSREESLRISESIEKEHLVFGDIDDCCDTVDRCTESSSSDYKEKEDYPPASSGSPDIKDYRVPNYDSGPTLDKSIQRDLSNVADKRKLKTVSNNVDIPTIVQDKEPMRMARSLPNMWPHDNDFRSNPEDLHSPIVL
ncbi:hypothetical protein CQW23_14999 [Capsicum baccatum]|uniref:Uncharacterized protein n=1 Tax=Capsicum baccatum TaxID=33114 RepID=A0A2G2WKT2_CAPBA|nr:hypothetical protein CQW23_14999 [Capsicum baccatum]